MILKNNSSIIRQPLIISYFVRGPRLLNSGQRTNLINTITASYARTLGISSHLISVQLFEGSLIINITISSETPNLENIRSTFDYTNDISNIIIPSITSSTHYTLENIRVDIPIITNNISNTFIGQYSRPTINHYKVTDNINSFIFNGYNSYGNFVSGNNPNIKINVTETLSLDISCSNNAFNIQIIPYVDPDNNNNFCVQEISNTILDMLNGSIIWTPTTSGIYYYISTDSQVYGMIFVDDNSLPKILALHGGDNNSSDFSGALQPLVNDLSQSFTFFFANAPIRDNSHNT